MNDESVIVALRRAMHTQTDGHHLAPGRAGTAWADAHAGRPRRRRTVLAIAASAVGVAGASVAVAVIRGGHGTPTPTGSSACSGDISTDALPTWARSGFSAGGLRSPHVLGADGEVVAVLFGELRAHQVAGVNNKILWVAKDGAGPLHIRARLEGADTTATLRVDLGPSVVDLPAPGCWQLTLTWAGNSDTVALRYE